MAGSAPGVAPAPGGAAPANGGAPSERDEISESIEQALKAARAQTAAAAAKAAGAASTPAEGPRSGGDPSGPAGGVSKVASGGDWSRMRNRISAEKHRENGSRAPKRYRRQVDEYFRSIARESAKQEGEAE